MILRPGHWQVHTTIGAQGLVGANAAKISPNLPCSDHCPSRQWPKDTKIRTYFDGDRSQEMNAIILGSKMKVDTYPKYVVRCPPSSSELSYIHLTEAHEEDGWQVVQEEPAGRENTSSSLPSPEVIKSIALEYTTTRSVGTKHQAHYSLRTRPMPSIRL